MRSAAPARWMQWNVQLDRSRASAEASARAVFAAIRPLIRTWRRQRTLRWFYFMRKRPDMRLRFCGADPQRALRPEFVSTLQPLVDGGAIRRYFETVYEPETRLFGGPEAMDLVHAYFDADAAIWMDLDRFAAAGNRTTTPEAVAAAVLTDLFCRTLEDRNEVWDVWASLAAAEIQREGEVLLPIAALNVGDLLSLQMPPAEARVLQRYVRANEKLGNGLAQLWARGNLASGLRATLAYVALFHCNRHGIDGVRRKGVARAVRDYLDPHQFGRGATCI